ncbi:glycerophosphodiester phosphodiesterase [Gracilibacillus caseinilyticus]|uniref:Glycerophosphodiester phosphodiesterase n=1 Tax=Gracilibacillus caseinilyticus TaxID=2932256 RepID=A0ABY4EY28_9BACI|nr:glycerophosphodiester phosphodiesterase family protein [Gracilibacillus caseinilyticus]UOQ49314.1 glycerophosphodiester phosphodiesterase [Gracilibacillus caseinilyticus]
MKKQNGWLMGIVALAVLCLYYMVESSMTSEALEPKNFGSGVLNIAHRGASGYAPEHTMIAYQIAGEMEADFLEIDVHMTSDDVLVAMHDEDVARTTDGEGFIQEMKHAEIDKLDAGSWFNQAYPDQADKRYEQVRVPKLTDIFDHFGTSTKYYIEIKNAASADLLLQTLEDYQLIEKNAVIIQSFDSAVLQKIYEQYPSLPLIQLLGKNKMLFANYKKIRKYAVGVGLPYQKLNQRLIRHLHRNGLLVHTYTVNDEADMKRLIEWGIDGIFTDYPDRLYDIKENRLNVFHSIN